MSKNTLFLTIPEPIMKKLEKDKKRRGFSKLQELIIDIVRENYFRKSGKTGARRGRPKKEIDEHKILRGEIEKGKRISEPWV